MLVIAPDGQLQFVYDEAMDLSPLGAMSIRRASHVEPDEQGRWWADLAPLGGRCLGPFARRSIALAAEVEFIESWLTADSRSPAAATTATSTPSVDAAQAK